MGVRRRRRRTSKDVRGYFVWAVDLGNCGRSKYCCFRLAQLCGPLQPQWADDPCGREPLPQGEDNRHALDQLTQGGRIEGRIADN